jgi:RND family efflux transporter MFP subunit
MQSLIDALKTLRPWQVLVLLAVVLGTGGAVYGIYSLVNKPPSSALADNQQTIPAQINDLVNQVSVSGGLLFATRETLTFGSQGTIDQVMVVEGQLVEEGQPLASFDSATVAGLERAVAQARVDLDRAETSLDEAQSPYPEEQKAQAELAVANARKALQDAKDSLVDLNAGPSAADVANAETDVAAAEESLANGQADQHLAIAEWDQTLEDAPAARDEALSNYRSVFERWLGIEASEDAATLDPDELLASLAIDLEALFGAEARSSGGRTTANFPSDDSATVWSEPVVFAWVNLFPGQILVSCEDGLTPPQSMCIAQEMDDRWDTYQIAKNDLEQLQVAGAKALAASEAAVESAERRLEGERETLADLQEAVDPLGVQIKESQLSLAVTSLTSAEEALAEINAGGDSLNIALRGAEVASAQGSLEQAQERLDDAVLRSSMDGMVSLVNVEDGQAVNGNTAAFEVVDPTALEVDGIVDEIDVLFVQVGAQATVTLDALPGQTLAGSVSSVAATGNNQNGVVTYPISIRVEVPQGVSLREGLTAVATVIIREEQNVLLVPLQSIRGSVAQPTVLVRDDGNLVERPVTLGSNDDFWVVIEAGLVPGEQVVIETEAASVGGLSFAALRGGSSFGVAVQGGGGQFRPNGAAPGGGGGGANQQR